MKSKKSFKKKKSTTSNKPASQIKLPALKIIHGEKSWTFGTREVSAAVSETGGQVAPVTFKLGGKTIQPFSIAPWAGEKESDKLIPILRALRGDFLCLPFGGNAEPLGKEKHPVHGETANLKWKLEKLRNDKSSSEIHLSLRTKIRPGRVDKKLFLVPGHTVIYSRHLISEMSGPMNPGLHAMLEFPSADGSGLISTSPFLHAQVFPEAFEKPSEYGYQSLKPGATFGSLEKVPLWNGGEADLSRYPARRGHEDLVMLASDPALPFAWTAVAFPAQGYVFFTLKDPRVLRSTVFWISNGGRHYAPWSGRHVNRMGLEEVTSYFHYGIKKSVESNPFSQKGFPTHVELDPHKIFGINVVMGVAAIPGDFGKVTAIEKNAGGIILRGSGGKSASSSLYLSFLEGAEPGR